MISKFLMTALLFLAFVPNVNAFTIVRDTIGPDSSATGVLDPGIASSDVLGNVDILTYAISPGNGGEIVQFDAVAGVFRGSCGGGVACYEDMTFRFLGWSSQAAVDGSRTSGELFDIDVTASYLLTPNFGSYQTGPFTRPTSLLEFDLAGLGALCPATGCVVALLADTSSTPDRFEIRRSTIPGPQDIFYENGQSSGIAGTAGVRIGIETATIPTPEPGTALLIGSGLAILSSTRRRD